MFRARHVTANGHCKPLLRVNVNYNVNYNYNVDEDAGIEVRGNISSS